VEVEPVEQPKVEVRRSAKRRRTVSARREGDTVVVLVPARLSKTEEAEWVTKMLDRLARSELRRSRATGRSDVQLMRRAAQLSTQWLDGAARPSVVRWVPAMRTRWASCTPSDATIRISERLRSTPGWVLDYVLVHELAHLLESGHTPRFWSLVHRFPRTERAMGYLQGLSAAAHLGIEADDDVAPCTEPED
jgi:predicted metal-dependent hydrolase